MEGREKPTKAQKLEDLVGNGHIVVTLALSSHSNTCGSDEWSAHEVAYMNYACSISMRYRLSVSRRIASMSQFVKVMC